MFQFRLESFVLAAALSIAACSRSPDAPAVTDGGDASPGVDASMEPDDVGSTTPPDATESDSSLGDVALEATEYCERTVDFFCDYYLRCGRMAAEDLAQCRAAFLESCNEVYEPRYASYAERGMLELSAQGVEACRAHLETVACEVQLYDLDLGCAGVWVGQVGAGEACAPGIGSFVCEPGTVCTLGLDLCGTCKVAADVGEACGGDVRCVSGAQCVDEICVRRALPGESCAEAPCVTGATCVNEICEGFEVVAVGEACDQARRCPYKASCIDGVCVESALLGEDCTGRECASGWCDAGVCAPFLAGGEACSSPGQCLSRICDGTCAPVERACFE